MGEELGHETLQSVDPREAVKVEDRATRHTHSASGYSMPRAKTAAGWGMSF
jgi:hypothetical protein